MSQENNADKVDELKGFWRDNPYTKYLLAKETHLQEIALHQLIAKCSESSDPKVLVAYSKYEAHLKAIKLLQSGDAK